jgi:predicted RNase H-like HicB family nuclease
MATKTIRISIKEMLENGEKYFLAESPDVPGFLAEAKTLEEMIEIAPLVMQDLLEIRNERLAKERKEHLLKYFHISLSFNKLTSLQLA